MLAKPKLDQISLNILAAADYMEKNGHCAFTREDEDGSVCALGAIDKIKYPTNLGCTSTFDEEVKRLAENLPAGNWVYFTYEAHNSMSNMMDAARLAAWNNELGRTKEEVVNFFREVAYNPKYSKVSA